jgi:hypothetical protein
VSTAPEPLPEGRLARERRRYADARVTVAALMRERGIDRKGVHKLAARIVTGKTWQSDPPFDRRERLRRYAWDFSRPSLLDPRDGTRQERAEKCLLGLRDSDFLGFLSAGTERAEYSLSPGRVWKRAAFGNRC